MNLQLIKPYRTACARQRTHTSNWWNVNKVCGLCQCHFSGSDIVIRVMEYTTTGRSWVKGTE